MDLHAPPSHVAKSSGAVESQSTQLLDFVLGRTTTSAPAGAWNDASGKGLPSSSASVDGNKSAASAKDASVDSRRTPGSAEASSGEQTQHYHFFGLAETQDQSQYPSDGGVSREDGREGGSESQKENTPTHVSSVPKTPTPPLAVLAPANGDKTRTGEEKASAVAFCAAKEDKDKAPSPLPVTPSRPLSKKVPPQVQQTKVVTFLSPAQKPSVVPGRVQKSSTPAPMRFRRKPRPRSPSPASQDSFAGPGPLEDPDLFLANAPQFEIPFEKLCADSSSEEEQEEEVIEEEEEEEPEVSPERKQEEGGRSHVEETPLKDERTKKKPRPPGRSVSQMTPYSLSSGSVRIERILVANSDESSGPSQDSHEHISQEKNSMQMSQQPTQVVDESTTTSMVVHPGESSSQQQVGDETQIIDETATQPSDAHPSTSEQPSGVPIQRTATAASIFAPSTASSAATGPRSLLNLVAPEKRHRYANIESPSESPWGHGGPFVPPSLQQNLVRDVHPLPGSTIPETVTTTKGTVSGASNAGTAGTPVTGSGRAVNLSSTNKVQGSNQSAISVVGVKRPRRSDQEEHVIPDSEAQVEDQLTSQRGTRARPPSKEANKKRKLEVIPASEPDLPSSLPPPARTIDDDGGDLTEHTDEEEVGVKQTRPLKKAQPASIPQGKGKQKLSALPPVAGSSRAAATAAPVKQERKRIFAVPPVPSSRQAAASSGTVKRRKAAAERFEVIPSSEPQNDLEHVERKKPVRAKKSAKANEKVAVTAAQQQRTVSPDDRGSVPLEGEDESESENSKAEGPVPSPEIPLAHVVRQEEEQTEIAGDDEHMDIDNDVQDADMGNEEEEEEVDELKSESATAVPPTLPPPHPSPELVHEFQYPRKRARRASNVAAAVDAPVPEPSAPAATASTKKKAPSKAATTTRRSTRKATKGAAKKGGQSAAKRAPKGTNESTGVRVLALWKGDSHYYVGTVKGKADNRYHVEFDDGTKDDVIEKHLRDVTKMQVGDILAPVGQTQPMRVTSIDDWEAEKMLKVVFIDDEDDEGEIVIRSNEVRIPSRTVNGLWEDRKLLPHEIMPTPRPRALNNTPTPSRASVTGGLGRNKMLARHGFVITLSPNSNNWERDKVDLTKTITDSGGIVIDDWSDILSFHGKHTRGDKRWTIDAGDIKVHKPKGVDRLFLISNDHSQKPKYLIALALGVPCVDAKWIRQMHQGIDAPWSSFLLPAGMSESLGARISQMVDLEWGDSPLHFQELMNNAVAAKILKDAKVLCIGAELLPPKKPPTDASRGAHFSVPRIIACMGAKRVEAVANAEHTSEKNLSAYDFVVVKDSPPLALLGKAIFVDIGWLKDCLFTGRQLPLPDFT